MVFGTPPIAARVLELLIRYLPEVNEAIDDEMAGSIEIESAVE